MKIKFPSNLKPLFILGSLSLLIWPILVLAGIMGTGGPNFGENVVDYIVIGFLFFYPVPVLAGAILGFVKWPVQILRKRQILGLVLIYIPVLILVAGFIIMVISSLMSNMSPLSVEEF